MWKIPVWPQKYDSESFVATRALYPIIWQLIAIKLNLYLKKRKNFEHWLQQWIFWLRFKIIYCKSENVLKQKPQKLMFNDFWTVLPVKDTIDFFLHLWNVLFYRLLHISRCVHIVKPFSNEVWKFNFVSTLFEKKGNCLIMASTCLS